MGGSHGRSFGTGKRELLGKAVALAACRPQPVEAVLIGGEVSAWADELIAAGADRVHVVESPLLSDFVEENYTEVLAGLVRKQHPSILLIGLRHAVVVCPHDWLPYCTPD